MPDSDAYQAAVQIGAGINRRTRNTVLAVSLVVICSNAVSLYLQRQQSAELHRATQAQTQQTARRLAAKSARNEALVVASAQGIRCILTIQPRPQRTFKQEQALVDRCFATFDRLNKGGGR